MRNARVNIYKLRIEYYRYRNSTSPTDESLSLSELGLFGSPCVGVSPCGGSLSQ
jgi:hypothetical protein